MNLTNKISSPDDRKQVNDRSGMILPRAIVQGKIVREIQMNLIRNCLSFSQAPIAFYSMKTLLCKYSCVNDDVTIEVQPMRSSQINGFILL